jgi:hypothetical protein
MHEPLNTPSAEVTRSKRLLFLLRLPMQLYGMAFSFFRFDE